jgi:RNA polymerase sigma factor (TIGR02999 family)
LFFGRLLEWITTDDRLNPAGEGRREVTQLLHAWRQGDQGAFEELVPLLYRELHRIAERYMRGERQGHTLQATALVNEAYLRLLGSSKVHWQNRAHFLAVSAQLMRRILVDFARSRRYQKRGGDLQRVSITGALAVTPTKKTDLIAINDALEELATLDARKSKVVEMRFFGGLSVKETAAVLDISTETVMRDWNMAKVWLLRHLSKSTSPGHISPPDPIS